MESLCVESHTFSSTYSSLAIKVIWDHFFSLCYNAGFKAGTADLRSVILIHSDDFIVSGESESLHLPIGQSLKFVCLLRAPFFVLCAFNLFVCLFVA